MKFLKSLIKLTFFAIAGGIIGYLLAKNGGNTLPSAKALGVSKVELIGLFFISIPAGLFVSVLIHELGHLFFGVSAGMNPIAMMVGPLCWRFNEEKNWPKLSIGRGISGGITVCIPNETTNINNVLARFLIGGPLASLLLGALCIASINYVPVIMKIPLGTTAAITILLGLYNLIPNTVFGLHTDGARLLAILRGGSFSEEMIAQFLLTAHMHNNGTPNNWPQEKIDILMNAKEFSPEWRAGQYYSYMKTKFSKDWPSAKTHLMRAGSDLGDMPQIMKNSYQNEIAAFDALCDHNFIDAAKTLRASGKGFLSQSHTEAIYQAIIHIADGEMLKAEGQLQLATKTTSNAIFKGTISLVQQDIQLLRAYIAVEQTT